MVRDAMLAISGLLDDRLGGPSFATRRLSRPRARRPCCTQRSTQDARTQPTDTFPCMGPRRPKRVAQCIRLPRSVDHHAAPACNDHAAPGPFTHEQRAGALSRRRVRRPLDQRGWARCRPASRLGLSTRAWRPAPGEREQARRVVERWAPHRWLGRFLTAMNFSILIDRLRGRTFWTVANFLVGAQWTGRRGLRSLHVRDGTLKAVNRARRSPRVLISRPRPPVRSIFVCGAMSHIDTFDYKPGLTPRTAKSCNRSTKPDVFFGQSRPAAQPDWAFRQRGQSGLWVSDLFPHWRRWPTS